MSADGVVVVEGVVVGELRAVFVLVLEDVVVAAVVRAERGLVEIRRRH